MPVTDERWAHAAKEPINAHALDHLSHLWQYIQNGNVPRRATSTVHEVTGHAPQTLAEFFSSQRCVFRRCQKLTGWADLDQPRQKELMSPQIIFQLDLVLAYVARLLCLATYFWPTLKRMDRVNAHRSTAFLHSFRFIGLVFLVPGVAGTHLPTNFAAYWDFATALLAILALLTVRLRPLSWVFVIAFNTVRNHRLPLRLLPCDQRRRWSESRRIGRSVRDSRHHCSAAHDHAHSSLLFARSVQDLGASNRLPCRQWTVTLGRVRSVPTSHKSLALCRECRMPERLTQ